ncbi:hypothetical protein BC938DRAFT_472160 [Jimgerdemannia flammicorona]|uniref:Uncharacterized protein n=1 Tax=Jimgerdemannia flammicorona TaxID=994334 RepID=A0A433Q6P9_9FUNG|nr:hypothetical protein BC938DRAFT_472160 [Jimgerdemannia flammicorona]
MHELRQLLMYGFLHYALNIWNFFDLLAYVLPVVYAFFKADDSDQTPLGIASATLESLAVLFLWLHAVSFDLEFSVYFLPSRTKNFISIDSTLILFYLFIYLFIFIFYLQLLDLRIISRQLGVFIAVLIEFLKEIRPFLFVLFAIVGAFAHALHLLLRYNPPSSAAPTEPNVYSSFVTSLTSVWIFSVGDYNGISNYGVVNPVYWPLEILHFAFSLICAIVLLNILMAVLNSVYTETVQSGQRAWRLSAFP